MGLLEPIPTYHYFNPNLRSQCSSNQNKPLFLETTGLKWRLYQIQFVLNRRACMVKEGLLDDDFVFFFLLNRNKDKALPRPCYQVCKARKLLEKRDLIISELHKEDEELARMEDAKRV